MTEIALRIDGMHCDACVRRVAAALSAVEGIHVEAVSVGAARIRAMSVSVTTQKLIEAVKNAGYLAAEENR